MQEVTYYPLKDGEFETEDNDNIETDSAGLENTNEDSLTVEKQETKQPRVENVIAKPKTEDNQNDLDNPFENLEENTRPILPQVTNAEVKEMTEKETDLELE
jgi:hypothetical protein